MGACHVSTSVLYVVFSELGYDVKLFVGEIQKLGEKPFDHSWITLDGKIIDIAVIIALIECVNPKERLVEVLYFGGS